MAGYSGTPLPKKLGVKPDQRVLLRNAPSGFADRIGLRDGQGATAPLDFVVVFTTEQAALRRELRTLLPKLAPAGMIWVAWPKRASRVPTDVTEDRVRDAALPLGLVDVKVCAIDATWSGLKLVRRLSARG
jgi:hypothetical protein